jgi:hypothetical protein
MPDSSPVFTPPMDRLVDEDSQIVRVPMDNVGLGFRKSQQAGVAPTSSDMRLEPAIMNKR